MEGKIIRETAGAPAAPGGQGKGRRSLRNTFEAFWKRRFLVLAVFIVIALILC